MRQAQILPGSRKRPAADLADRATGKRPDMGKSCVRFRSPDDVPLDLIGDAIAMTPVDEFVAIYEASRSRPGR